MQRMSARKDDELSRSNRQALLARKMKQSEEGQLATSEYRHDQKHTLDNLALLKAQRLARESAVARVSLKRMPKPPVRKIKRVKPRG
jgi:hypothetical protein